MLRGLSRPCPRRWIALALGGSILSSWTIGGEISLPASVEARDMLEVDAVLVTNDALGDGGLPEDGRTCPQLLVSGNLVGHYRKEAEAQSKPEDAGDKEHLPDRLEDPNAGASVVEHRAGDAERPSDLPPIVTSVLHRALTG
jgi:hypothetical protein